MHLDVRMVFGGIVLYEPSKLLSKQNVLQISFIRTFSYKIKKNLLYISKDNLHKFRGSSLEYVTMGTFECLGKNIGFNSLFVQNKL